MQNCIWPSWCRCHSLSLASVKSRLVLPFCYRLTPGSPWQRLLNVCVCVWLWGVVVDSVYIQNWTRRRAATMDTSGINLASMSAHHVIPPLFHSLSVGSPPGSAAGHGLGSAPSTPLSVALSPRSLAFYTSEDTVESVIGQSYFPWLVAGSLKTNVA